MKILRHLRELWQYRELTYNLVVRNLKVRYKSSVLGIAWSWLNPLLMMIVYTVFFTIFLRNAGIPHYPVFLLCGLLPWNFFTDAVLQATGSIVSNATLTWPWRGDPSGAAISQAAVDTIRNARARGGRVRTVAHALSPREPLRRPRGRVR